MMLRRGIPAGGIGRTIVDQLDIFNAHVYTFADFDVASPRPAITPKIEHNHAFQLRDSIGLGILYLVVHEPS
jgi:hypothetical protein